MHIKMFKCNNLLCDNHSLFLCNAILTLEHINHTSFRAKQKKILGKGHRTSSKYTSSHCNYRYDTITERQKANEGDRESSGW